MVFITEVLTDIPPGTFLVILKKKSGEIPVETPEESLERTTENELFEAFPEELLEKFSEELLQKYKEKS